MKRIYRLSWKSIPKDTVVEHELFFKTKAAALRQLRDLQALQKVAVMFAIGDIKLNSRQLSDA